MFNPIRRPTMPILWLVLGVLSCGKTSFRGHDDLKPAPKELDAASLTVDSLEILPAQVTLHIGEKNNFKARAHFSNGSIEDVTNIVSWLSRDPRLGSIDDKNAKGEFTAKVAGQVTVSAEYDPDIHADAIAKVVDDPTTVPVRITLQYLRQMRSNDTQRIVVTAIYSDGSSRDVTDQSQFQSRNPAILACQPSAIVRGVSSGSSVIDVDFSGLKAAATIEVLSQQIISIAITPANKVMAIGQQFPFTLTGTFDQGGTIILTAQATWSSSNPAAVSISDSSLTKGQAQAKAAGTVTVTATYQSLSATAQVTVTSPTLDSLSIEPMNPSVRLGQSIAMRAYAHFSDGNVAEVTDAATWVSSVPTIGLFSTVTKGSVSTLAAGTTNLTASFNSKSATTTLTVQADAPTCVSFTASKTSLTVGESFDLTVVGSGDISSATIDNTALTASPFLKTLTPSTVGVFTYNAFLQGPGGRGDCSPINVTVNPVVIPAPSCSLASNKTTYSPNEQIQLTVTGSNISTATIAGIVDSASPFVQSVAAPNTAGPLTFSASANNSDGASSSCGSVSISVVVPAAPAPVCSLSANKTTYAPGEQITLTVLGTNISAADIAGTNNISAPFIKTLTASSTPGPVSYSAAARNSDGVSSSCGSVTVNVSSPAPSAPLCSIASNKQTYAPGEQITLTVTGTNVSSATIEGILDSAAPFSQTVTAPSASGSVTYAATAANGDGLSASCGSVSVMVAAPAAVCTLSADKTNYVFGEVVTLSVSGSNIRSATIEGQVDNAAPFQAAVIAPSVAGPKTFSATARNADDVAVTCSATAVNISAPAPSCTFSSDTASVDLGKSFYLRASVSNASKVVIDGTTFNGPFTTQTTLSKLKTADTTAGSYPFNAQVFPLGSNVAQACPPVVSVNYVAPACVASTASSVITFEGLALNSQVSTIGSVSFSLDVATAELPIVSRLLTNSETPTSTGAETAWRCGSCGGTNFNKPADSATATIVGSNFLTIKDGYTRSVLPDLIITYPATQPSSFASGYLVDIDHKETWKMTAYDAAGAEVATTTLSASDTTSGNGKASYWKLSSTRANIAKIRIHGTDPGGVFGFAFDRFSAYAPICSP